MRLTEVKLWQRMTNAEYLTHGLSWRTVTCAVNCPESQPPARWLQRERQLGRQIHEKLKIDNKK